MPWQMWDSLDEQREKRWRIYIAKMICRHPINIFKIGPITKPIQDIDSRFKG